MLADTWSLGRGWQYNWVSGRGFDPRKTLHSNPIRQIERDSTHFISWLLRPYSSLIPQTRSLCSHFTHLRRDFPPWTKCFKVYKPHFNGEINLMKTGVLENASECSAARGRRGGDGAAASWVTLETRAPDIHQPKVPARAV